MSYTILDVQSDLEGILHGTTINKVKNPFNLYYRAGRVLLTDLDPAETKRMVAISNALYDKVYDYVAPPDLKGNRVIDLLPQSDQRSRFDQFDQNYGKTFDLRKQNLTFQIEENHGVKTLRVAKTLNPATVISNANSITANGTWLVGGTASNLTVDMLNFLTGNASLRFDATAGTAYIENVTLAPVDLTNHLNESTLFIWLYVPTGAVISNVTLTWGDNVSTKYWSQTVTTAFNSAFVTGWNLLGFSWTTATETSTPNPAAIIAAKLAVTVTTGASGFRIDNLVSNLGQLYNIKYYSKFLFSDSNGTWIEKPTTTSDYVNLDTDSYNIFLFKVAEFCALQLQEEPHTRYGINDATWFKAAYEAARDKYKVTYKSEASTPSQNYYQFGLGIFDRGISRFDNRP